MGGDLSSFGRASMFDYEILLAAYKLKHGVDGAEALSTDDLDSLYAGVGEHIASNPEAWIK